MRMLARWCGLAGLLVAGLATSLGAQTTYPNVRVSGRLQEQFYYFGNDDYRSTTGANSNFFTRRARIEARGSIAENITFYIQPSFEGGRPLSASSTCAPVVVDPALGVDTIAVSCSVSGNSGIRLRDAWIEARLTKAESRTAFYLRAGQEKRPFSRYELTSSTNLPTIERGGGRGLLASGSNDLFGGAGFLSHDVGASVRVEHKIDDVRRVGIMAGAYNGRGESLNDNNNAKSFGARATVGLWKKLEVGGNYFSRDNIVGADSAFRNHAWGVDAQWGKVGDEGLFLLAEYLDGQAANAAKTKMRGMQAVAAYNIRMKRPAAFLYAIEPVARVDIADPDTDAGDNKSTLITAGLGLYLSSRAQLRVVYENQSFEASGAESISGVRSQFQVNF